MRQSRPSPLITVFVILDVVWVLMQIGGQYLAASAQAASYTNTAPFFAVGTSQLIFLAGNVLQVSAKTRFTIDTRPSRSSSFLCF